MEILDKSIKNDIKYPIRIELDVDQDDFIETELLEEAADIPLAKRHAKNTFIFESGAVILGFVLCRIFRDRVAFEANYLLLGFWLLFLVNFLYNYYRGIDRDFAMSVRHYMTNREDHRFFTPEKGEVNFYPDRVEYLTNEQRRYFTYRDIGHIKITRHLFIFIMKRSKEKAMNGFVWMVIPKRNMSLEEEELFKTFCRDLKEKYPIGDWTDCRLFD